MENQTKAKYAVYIKFLDVGGNVVEKTFDTKTTIFHEFIAQGQMFSVQTCITDQKIVEKDNVATLENFYVPTKNILELRTLKTLRLDSADKERLLFDVFDVAPEVHTTVLPPTPTEPTTDTPIEDETPTA